MPRPTKRSLPENPQGPDAEVLERLVDAVESVAGQIEVLRNVLDEIREDLGWAINNDRFRCPPHACQVTSMPVDPCAEDWPERLIRLKPVDLPSEEAPPSPPPAAPAAPAPDRPNPAEHRPTKTKHRRAGKGQALSMRIYFQPHLTEVVRLIGYQGLPLPEAQKQFKVLCEQYGEENMHAAVEEVVHIDTSQDPPMARLTEQARKVSFGLLGPAPATVRSAAPSSPNDAV